MHFFNKPTVHFDDCLMAGPLFVVLKVAYVGRMEDYLVVPIKPIFFTWSMKTNNVRAWHPSSSIKLLPKDYRNITIESWLLNTISGRLSTMIRHGGTNMKIEIKNFNSTKNLKENSTHKFTLTVITNAWRSSHKRKMLQAQNTKTLSP